jgi:DNA-binding NarL/FixJ family response regulator
VTPDILDASAEQAETIREPLVRGGRLSLDLRTALLLRDVVGLSYNEIADTLDVSLPTVKWRIYKAREQVQSSCRRSTPSPTPPQRADPLHPGEMRRARFAGRRIGPDTSAGDRRRLEAALESINVPSYVVDRSGVIRWLNKAARRLVGDVRGRQFTSVVAPEETRRAREVFARNIRAARPDGLAGGDDRCRRRARRLRAELRAADAGRPRSASSPGGGRRGLDPTRAASASDPRQTEVLGLLEQGRSTNDIAAELQLSIETVRNHIRHILRALGVHSRLQAVAISRRCDLVPG